MKPQGLLDITIYHIPVKSVILPLVSKLCGIVGTDIINTVYIFDPRLILEFMFRNAILLRAILNTRSMH